MNAQARLAHTAVQAAEHFAENIRNDRATMLALIPDGDTYTVYAPNQWRHQRLGVIDERAVLRRRYAAALTRHTPTRRGPVFAGVVAGRRCGTNGVHVTVTDRTGHLCDLHWRCCNTAIVGTVTPDTCGLLPTEVVAALQPAPVYLRPLQQVADELGLEADGDAATLHDRILDAQEQGVEPPTGLDPLLWALLGHICPGPRDLEELLTGVWRPLDHPE